MTEALRLGDYSLELELGRGAVGVVHRGRSADGRVVAIKTFDPALADDETFRARLAHEARVAREIVDPHLVRILEAGEDDGRPYLVLEYLSGRLSRGEARGGAAASRGDAAGRGRGGGRPRRPSSGRHRPPGRQAVERPAPRGRLGGSHRLRAREGCRVHGPDPPGQVLGTLDYLAPELVRGGRRRRRATSTRSAASRSNASPDARRSPTGASSASAPRTSRTIRPIRRLHRRSPGRCCARSRRIRPRGRRRRRRTRTSCAPPRGGSGRHVVGGRSGARRHRGWSEARGASGLC